MGTSATPRIPALAALAVAGVIFLFDTFTPLGVAEWVFYLVPILIAANLLSHRAIYLVAAVCTVLIVLGFFFSPPGINPVSGALNRLLQVAVLWLVALLLAQRRQMEEKLLVQQANLADQVQARTAELQQELAERTQMEQELRHAAVELERANAGKDAFLSAVSHELRTPLMGITTLTDVLEMQMNGALGEREHRYMKGIRDSGERLLVMVNDILRYTSLFGGHVVLRREPCRLAGLCAVSIRAVAPKAEQKGQTLQLEVLPFDLEVHSDADAIVRMLDALLDNAVKFTPNLGHIGVVVRECPGASVQLTVWDTGIGIGKEQVPYLFEPFAQADQSLARRYGGLGLGLAYVHRMVAMLGGSVAVESSLGDGSRFVVTLPCDPATDSSGNGVTGGDARAEDVARQAILHSSAP